MSKLTLVQKKRLKKVPNSTFGVGYQYEEWGSALKIRLYKVEGPDVYVGLCFGK